MKSHCWRMGLAALLCCGSVWMVAAEPAGAAKTPPKAARRRPPVPTMDFVPRAQFEENFRIFAEKLRGKGPERVDPAMTIEASEPRDGFVRHRVAYNVEPGERIDGWLLVPADRKPGERLPLMLCLHGTNLYGKDAPVNEFTGLPPKDARDAGRRANRAYALDLVKRGFVCFAPDRAGYGKRTPEGAARGIPGMNAYMQEFRTRCPDWRYHHGKVVQDLQQALDFLEKLEFVDPERIGVIGLSLGGRDSMEIAAFDARIRATVMFCGGNLKFQPELWTDAEAQRKYAEAPRDDQGTNTNFYLQAIAPRAYLGVIALNDYLTDYPRNIIDAARPMKMYYDMLLGSPKALGESPRFSILMHTSEHDTPRYVRELAYAWLDRQFGIQR